MSMYDALSAAEIGDVLTYYRELHPELTCAQVADRASADFERQRLLRRSMNGKGQAATLTSWQGGPL